MSCKDKHAVDFDEIGVSKLMVFYSFLFSVWYTLVGIFIHCSSNYNILKSNSLIIQIELITVYYFIRVLVMYGIPKVKSYFLHVTWHLITKRIKIQTTFDSSIPANNFCSQAFLLASKNHEYHGHISKQMFQSKLHSHQSLLPRLRKMFRCCKVNEIGYQIHLLSII